MPELNRAYIEALIQAVETKPIPGLGFDMSSFVEDENVGCDPEGHICGTTACLAGTSHLLKGHVKSVAELVEFFGGCGMEYSPSAIAIKQAAIDMGLTVRQAGDLFYAGNLLQEEAVAELRHLLAHGTLNVARGMWFNPDRAEKWIESENIDLDKGFDEQEIEPSLLEAML